MYSTHLGERMNRLPHLQLDRKMLTSSKSVTRLKRTNVRQRQVQVVQDRARPIAVDGSVAPTTQFLVQLTAGTRLP